MDQHPIPRQITTFEFKLIGFLTIRQFIYLVVFIPLGLLVYSLFPIPLLNVLLGIIIGAIGPTLAFVPVNDRPLEVWVRNLYKRLTSPTQYFYRKQNPPIYFLKNLVFEADPHQVFTHIHSQELLNQYLKTKQGSKITTTPQKQNINQLLQQPLKLKSNLQEMKQKERTPQKTSPINSFSYQTIKSPFFTGIVKNHKNIPLPGILIYVKNGKGEILRLLKTNPHGVFATFNPLVAGEYIFELKDPHNNYFFDTMKINIENNNPKPLEFFSKELL